MKGTLEIQGMMCEKCQEKVKQALEALDFTSNCIVDLEAKTATVDIIGTPSMDMLTDMNKAVTAAGFKVAAARMG